MSIIFFFSSRRRHTRFDCDWSSDVCSSDLKDVVGSGATSCDQLIADFLRKRNVHQAVAMYVADFSSPQAVFCTPKAMRLGCDPGPALQSGIDSFFRSRNKHGCLLRKPSNWM